MLQFYLPYLANEYVQIRLLQNTTNKIPRNIYEMKSCLQNFYEYEQIVGKIKAIVVFYVMDMNL